MDNKILIAGGIGLLLLLLWKRKSGIVAEELPSGSTTPTTMPTKCMVTSDGSAYPTTIYNVYPGASGGTTAPQTQYYQTPIGPSYQPGQQPYQEPISQQSVVAPGPIAPTPTSVTVPVPEPTPSAATPPGTPQVASADLPRVWAPQLQQGSQVNSGTVFSQQVPTYSPSPSRPNTSYSNMTTHFPTTGMLPTDPRSNMLTQPTSIRTNSLEFKSPFSGYMKWKR